MKLTREEILQIAKLSRLYLEEEEIVRYQDDLGSILGYVEKLQELSVDGIPEFQHAAGGVNVFREDKIDSCSQESREQIRENFSAREGDLLKVQAVFENRTL